MRNRFWRRSSGFIGMGIGLLAIFGCQSRHGDQPGVTRPVSSSQSTEILVSAAASLTDALTEIGAAYARQNPGRTVRFNFGASGALARQLAQGGPVDAFVSAGEREMDDLARRGLIRSETRRDIAGNDLVLIAPRTHPLRDWTDLAGPGVRRFTMPNPDSVPAGRYGKLTLTHRGLWTKILPKWVPAHDVRQALTYVVSGNVDAGIVFITDARHESGRVQVVGTAVAGVDHPPIRYPAAAITGAPNPEAAAAFVAFLASPDAGKILVRYGFRPILPSHRGDRG